MAAAEPYGDVPYADPGYLPDGKKRYPIDAEHVEAAWSYINQAGNAAKYTAEQLKAIKARIGAAMKQHGHQVAADTTEAFAAGEHPHVAAGSSQGGQFAPKAGTKSRSKTTPKKGRPTPGRPARPAAPTGNVVFDGSRNDPRVKGLQEDLNRAGARDAQGKPLLLDGRPGPRTQAAVRSLQRRLGMKPDGVVTPQLLAAIKGMKPMPAKKAPPKKAATRPAVTKRAPVRATHGDAGDPEQRTVEAADTIEGQVLESLDDAADGGRVFRVRIIRVGESKNGRNYTDPVLRRATPMYEGAKAYDHHRTPDELRTSTINGLVGSYRNVAFEAGAEAGIAADLHLLPSAAHTAEALDASLAAQAAGRPPLVGISHDVHAHYRTVRAGGRHMQEATAITKVNSADVVADPAAGGIATRMVAGGLNTDTEESDVTVTTEAVLAALESASDDELAAVGLARTSESTEPEEQEDEPTQEAYEEPYFQKGTVWADMAVKAMAEAAQLNSATVAELLPQQFTESHVAGAIQAVKTVLAKEERADLRPTATVQVTQEAHQKKVGALDAFFAQDFRNGYRSFKEAFCDITGRRPQSFDEDFNKVIMQESVGNHYDSDGRIVGGERSTESLNASTWNLVLGDSITRRLVAEYDQPSLQSYKAIVSSTVPVNDFRTQRIDRIGGYGTLPAVNQGAAYNPLTSPTNEEVTYALTKRGGTEDLTLEMIANDDVRSISRIPKKLGLAAAQTLFRFVWDFLDTNPAIFDSVTLFNASHGSNTATNALSQSNLSAGRLAMRSQTAYGDTANNLSIIPKTLIVVNDLEELAFQLTTSAVAVPATPAGPSNTPNLHRGLDLIIPDYWSSSTKWILVADTNVVPTFELGFYQGREQPELFTQSDPTVGSMFNADTLTLKIRHIYSGAVLDWRGFYRGNT